MNALRAQPRGHAKSRPLGMALIGVMAATVGWSASADGSVLFSATAEIGGVASRDIFVMAADGSNVVNPTETTGIHEGAPRWSPDHSKIVFHASSGDPSGWGEIWVMDAVGGDRQQLTTSGVNYTPSWSPDGSQIAYGHKVDGTSDVWVMDGDGGNAYNLTQHGTGNVQYSDWSPDGAWIVYATNADGLGGIGDDALRVARVDGTINNGVGNTSQAGYPRYSPDGTEIAYYVAGAGIFAAPPSGGAPRAILAASGDYPVQATWRPDGSALMYMTAPTSAGPWEFATVSVTGGVGAVVSGAPVVTTTGALPDPDWSNALVPRISLAAPLAGETLASGTTNTPLTVVLTDHPAPGHWHWQLDTPFPDTGVAGGTHVDPDVLTDTIPGLVDGAAHTVYVALVSDASHNLVDATDNIDVTDNIDSRDNVAFSVATDGGGPPTDAVTIGDAQAAAGAEVTIPVDIYDTSALTPGVTGIDLTVTYDETLLTPTSDAGGVTSASVTVLTTGWSIAQNVVTPGELDIVMGAEFAGEFAAGGTILNLTFGVDAAAATNTTSPVGLSRALLNEGLVSSSAVEGTFTVVNFMYGDVTGNGAWSGYDASHVLEHVARENLDGSHHTFSVEDTAPIWAPLPLMHEEAEEVANVDGDMKEDPNNAAETVPDISANDVSLILQRAVSIITMFPVEAAAPSALPIAVGRPLRASATSQRPGARITVSLDASALSDLRAGELVLDFDSGVLRPVDVALRPQETSGATQRPLLTQREGDGRIAVAFASARPMGASDALLEVTFEASRHVSRARESAIRASHLRLNRSLIETDFAFPFRIEPFQTRLMANYPNPFNPETWIPFELAADSDVTIRIYGLDGGLVRTLELGARGVGEHVGREDAAYWDGRNAEGEAVASGVYMYELAAGDYHALRRMVVMK
ncbi:hypothetical protein CMK11_20185 [Candidatus Poribacteria bacterium]|nr:hypothetical protein [Candidatus Poribacteria bacterium]